MKDFLYLQYLVIRPMGVAPDDKDFDRKAEFALHNIMDDERQANILFRTHDVLCRESSVYL